ncbi:MAG: type II 3-dehydroquinate dehydratase [Myxococcota bacterium]
MFKRLLVVHGPNLNLLGERAEDEPGVTLGSLEALIRARAGALGLEVKFFQSNHEGKLVDFLHAERQWADGIVINPGALTHYSYVLREALFAVGRPAIEVHLTDIRRRESWRRKSVIKDVCAAQVMGKGADSYLAALERFARGDLTGRQRRKAAKVPAPPKKTASGKSTAAKPPSAPKTLGRPREPASPPSKLSVPAGNGASAKTLGRAPVEARRANEALNRAQVRQKIADRLAGKLSPAGLASWARGQYLEVQRGAPAESGYRELLEDSLQSLTLSTMPASKLSEEQLIELMAQLEG